MTSRHTPGRIVLVGLPGTGKTSVARQIARKLGPPWRHCDTDELIVARQGCSIAALFADQGEAAFRQLEQQEIARLEGADSLVLATGGGAVLDPENRRSLWSSSLVIQLRAQLETLVDRTASHGRPGATRPLLDGDPAERLARLSAERGALYDRADYTIHTDSLFPDQVAELIVDLHRRLGEQLLANPNRSLAWTDEPAIAGAAAVVRTGSARYGMFVGSGELGRLGDRMRDAGLSGKPTVVADEAVAALYGEAALASLRGAGFDAGMVTIAGGERSKHLSAVSAVYDRLVERRSERGDPIVALGGGVTTDLAGFVAASYLRGVPLVHVPTSLLGMVDAAIGGKVGVDHPRGKNLIGAFYQPRLVVADVDVLRSLQPRELTAGWAEVIKHALILDPSLLSALERDADRIMALDADVVVPVLQRSAQLKAKVVSADEREGGARMVLNYGHTIGHAIESATGYDTVLHGEAVAIGMEGAAQIASALGILSATVAERQRRLLHRFGLPTTWPGVDLPATMQAMKLDKKVSASRQRWVLLSGVGRTEIRDDVPRELVIDVVARLIGS